MSIEHLGRRSQHSFGSNQSLPNAITRCLAPQIGDALDHPMRRAILRQLNKNPGVEYSPAELLVHFPGCSLATVAGQIAVLYEAGCLKMTTVPGARGAPSHRIASDVAADSDYVMALAVTEYLDAHSG